MRSSSSPVTFWKCNTGIGGASSTTNEDLRRSLERVRLVRSLTFRGMAGDMGECSTITEGCSQSLRFAQGDNRGKQHKGPSVDAACGTTGERSRLARARQEGTALSC